MDVMAGRKNFVSFPRVQSTMTVVNNLWFISALGALILAGAGCRSSAESRPDDEAVYVSLTDTTRTDVRGTDTDPGSTRGSTLIEFDNALLAALPGPISALAASNMPSDESGLIGRNREWGAMYSPRFQTGTGFSLRIVLAAGRFQELERVYNGIVVGFSTMEADGTMPSRVPAEVGQGALPLRQDIASAAAFFLGDACTGLLAMGENPEATVWVSKNRQDLVAEHVRAAMQWISGEVDVLQQADATAPNRLLFNARTFIACGALLEQPQLVDVGEDFIARALALQRPDGVFLEGGGHDTSYQAVALRIGYEVLALKDSEPLRDALQKGTLWLLERACENGRIDSTDNTRTCSGGESFLGVAKLLSITDVLMSFLAYYVIFDEARGLLSSQRLVTWYGTNPATSCYEEPEVCQ